MPCYTIRKVSVDLKAADAGLLEAALEKAGLRAHVGANLKAVAESIVKSGKLTLAGATEARAAELAAQVSRHYAEGVVRFAAKKFGFNVAAKSPERLTLKKRTF